MLGIDAYMIASGGWKLSRENVDKLIPDLHDLMSGLPRRHADRAFLLRQYQLSSCY
jgi:hypothetical protein